MIQPDAPIGETELERALLDAGRSYRSSAEARAKTLIALGLAGSTAAGAASAAGAWWLGRAIGGVAAKMSVTTGWTKLALIVVLAGVAAGVPAGYHARQGHAPAAQIQPAAAAAPSPREAPAPVAVVAAPAVAAPAPDAPAAAAPARPRAAAGFAARPARLAAQNSMLAAPAPVAPTLAAELTELDQVRTALAAGDPARALALLDAYGRAHPRGSLQLEGEILRIDALGKSGRPDVAKSRAEAFLRRHPNSVLAPRARGLLRNLSND